MILEDREHRDAREAAELEAACRRALATDAARNALFSSRCWRTCLRRLRERRFLWHEAMGIDETIYDKRI